MFAVEEVDVVRLNLQVCQYVVICYSILILFYLLTVKLILFYFFMFLINCIGKFIRFFIIVCLSLFSKSLLLNIFFSNYEYNSLFLVDYNCCFCPRW